METQTRNVQYKVIFNTKKNAPFPFFPICSSFAKYILYLVIPSLSSDFSYLTEKRSRGNIDNKQTYDNLLDIKMH